MLAKYLDSDADMCVGNDAVVLLVSTSVVAVHWT
jgi:hypothetical protein